MPKRKLPTGIVRFEYERARPGYFARIQRAGECKGKLFADADFGSKAAALEAAVKWRRTQDLALRRSTGVNPDDVGGIYRVKGWKPSRGWLYWEDRFEARVRLNGVQFCRSFSVKRHGEEEARKQAERTLRKWRQQATRSA